MGEWFWATSQDSESYDGPYETKEDAIAEARGTLDAGHDEHFYVGEGVRVDPGDVMGRCFDLDGALEWASERAYEDDVGGDWVEDWLPNTCPKEAEAEFKAFIEAWARKHFPVKYWVVGSKGLEEVLVADD
jgi:hypothetical protein